MGISIIIEVSKLFRTPQCMEIKVSYVQARRFIDFHTLDPE